MADVFVSYARKSLNPARRLVEALRAEGFDVWWDQDIPADAEWDPAIEGALEAAKCVIVCWTREAAASENVRAEARSARHKRLLLQAYLEPCNPPFFFGERQGADLTEWDGSREAERFQLLADGVRAIQSGKRPRAGLGYRPRERRMFPILLAAFALLAAAGVGLLWIPEIRERIFPMPPVIWTMKAGSNADIRPADPPGERPLNRMVSETMVGLAAEFATEGGREADAVIASQRARLLIPKRAPVEMVWWWFTGNTAETDYLNVIATPGPFTVHRGGSKEIFFMPEAGYRWSEFVRDANAAHNAGGTHLEIEVVAEIESEGETQELSARCTLAVGEIVQLMREQKLGLKWISLPCRNTTAQDGVP